MKRVLLSWSSGKDSAWALHALRGDATVTVVGLLTTLNGPADRVAMHAVRRELLEIQAAAAGLPLVTVGLPSPCTNDEYERLIGATIAEARGRGVTHVAFGDLFLEDVRAYRIRTLAGTGIDPMFPIWSSPAGTRSLALRMIQSGIRARITCVDAAHLDPSFLGREFNEELLADLPPSVDPCGERGEFHTFCHSGPGFAGSIPTVTGETEVSGQFHFIDLRISAGPLVTSGLA
ncbi:MAG: ATP-binding protein [Gemmatimonadota bacterium]